MRFEFGTAQRIVFGAGTLKEAGPIAREFGQQALVVTGRNRSRSIRLLDILRAAGVEADTVSIDGEPTTDAVVDAASRARQGGIELVVGFGGGSAIDAAKAVAGLVTNPGSLFDYLEVIGSARPLSRPGLPVIAIPTSAGAGAEATRNAVLLSPAHKLKVSLRSPHLLPRVAIVDPELTYSLPSAETAATGLDALTQLLEPFVSIRANPMTDALCREGIARAVRSLPIVHRDGRDAGAREDMAIAALFGGVALANAGLGAVHGFAAPIGGMFNAPHGAVCAALLPHVTAANTKTLGERLPGSPALSKYAEVERMISGDLVNWLRDIVAALRIPPLRSYGIATSDSAAIVKAAAASSSMKGNPIALTEQELQEILAAALQER